MKRREFISLLGGAAVAWPVAARAQQPQRIRTIGVLGTIAEDDPHWTARLMAFERELQRAGWSEGRNVRFERRSAPADSDRTRSHATELVALAPDVILTSSNIGTAILGGQTRTIPIVFVGTGEPVETGLVPNMARPGGNITGFALLELGIGGKWLELLKEIEPSLRRVAVIYTQGGPGSEGLLHTLDALAPSFGVNTTSIPARDASQLERAISAFSSEPNSGLIAVPGPAVLVHRAQIIAAAARHRLPAIYAGSHHVTSGGLMSYGADLTDLYRRAAAYVDRILRGEKPGELPVQLPTKFELVINLKTAKALGLTVPRFLLARADEVIE
jgi:putative ABC transport system substrate-binding protein